MVIEDLLAEARLQYRDPRFNSENFAPPDSPCRRGRFVAFTLHRDAAAETVRGVLSDHCLLEPTAYEVAFYAARVWAGRPGKVVAPGILDIAGRAAVAALEFGNIFYNKPIRSLRFFADSNLWRPGTRFLALQPFNQ